MIELYNKVCFETRKIFTNRYSTSFSLGILALDKEYRDSIYSIYGLVRIADEIVDTFLDSNKKELLDKLKDDTYNAIRNKLSSNPILQSFQITVNKYKIPTDLIDAFFHSMEMDIYQGKYSRGEYDKYVYGSAEVVGLMCLRVFVNGDESRYNELVPQARSLGSAFQKVNFLRDLGSDINERKRIYIPEVYDVNALTEEQKQKLIKETEREFELALDGIKKLPAAAKLGVYSAYLYYLTLLKKIKREPVLTLLTKRVRVNNLHKFFLLIKAFVQVRLLRVV
ncbi:MAG: phytoene/squalene synthase family protein [Ignavibacteria bacterium]|jgi:phytoene/squalene synthetase|nr:phytoene/squalene synthase family protein [Ignavibacteria bacterium]MDH7526854.1 phytoene/squalene synthase family protein [Ignavibacteria bacterium]